MPEELANAPKCPPNLAYLWLWYWDVASPPDRLSFKEVESWANLNNRKLLAWEVDMLKRVDNIRVEVANSE